MKNISINLCLTLVCSLLYSMSYGQTHRGHHHPEIQAQDNVFSNPKHQQLFHSAAPVLELSTAQAVSTIVPVEMTAEAEIEHTFASFGDIIHYLDESKSHHKEGYYSSGILDLGEQTIDSVDNYLVIDRTMETTDNKAYQLKLTVFSTKEEKVLAKTEIIHHFDYGIVHTETKTTIVAKKDQSTPIVEDQYRVFPIPTSKELIIQGTSQQVDLEVLNTQGATVLRLHRYDATKKPLNIETLPSGQYFVRIIDLASKVVEVHKVVKL